MYSDETKRKIRYLISVFKANGYKIEDVISKQHTKIDEENVKKKSFSKEDIKEMIRHFNNLKEHEIYDDSYTLEKLKTDTSFKQVNNKVKYLNQYLLERKEISLARVLSLREGSLDYIYTGKALPKKRIINKISQYFFLKPQDLLDDAIKLPPYDEITIDEELYDIQKSDKSNKINFFKHKHYIKRNFRILSYPKRISLVLFSLLIILPLVGYTAYCAYSVSSEKNETLDKYKLGSDETETYDKYDETQSEYHENIESTSKENKPDAYYCDVRVGTKLYRIHSIDASTSNYKTKMEVYFIFDKDEFKNMFSHYAKRNCYEQIIKDFLEDETIDQSLKNEKYNTIEDFIAFNKTNETFFDNWVDKNDVKYYPGETTSNNYIEKQTMFDVGNGSIVPDSLSYIKDLEEMVNEEDNKTYCYQKVIFEGTFDKAFDSVRYPLDSAQFKMYVKPTMDAQYLRYIPDKRVTEDKEYISGFSPYFAVTNGYRLLKETDEIKNFNLRVNYYKDVNNDPSISYDSTYRTQLEIVVRANRQGISLFLKAFINLFSVVIWILIAFYNQSYNGEDSIGMLGTGLFGVISSMLVGLNMISDAGIFSIITMINIFTLGVIMIMAYQAISAKRAQVRGDKVLIAYNGIKLRVLFYILTICTIIMFVGLPVLSYMFGL